MKVLEKSQYITRQKKCNAGGLLFVNSSEPNCFFSANFALDLLLRGPIWLFDTSFGIRTTALNWHLVMPMSGSKRQGKGTGRRPSVHLAYFWSFQFLDCATISSDLVKSARVLQKLCSVNQIWTKVEWCLNLVFPNTATSISELWRPLLASHYCLLLLYSTHPFLFFSTFHSKLISVGFWKTRFSLSCFNVVHLWNVRIVSRSN